MNRFYCSVVGGSITFFPNQVDNEAFATKNLITEAT